MRSREEFLKSRDEFLASLESARERVQARHESMRNILNESQRPKSSIPRQPGISISISATPEELKELFARS